METDTKTILNYTFMLVLTVFIFGQLWQAYTKSSVTAFKITPLIFIILIYFLFLILARVLGDKFKLKEDWGILLIVLILVIGIFLLFTGWLPEPFKAPIIEIQSIIGG